MKLVIIEGEGKKETVSKYLKKIDPEFTVFATKGHVRDLPNKTLAVNVTKNFEPKYTVMDDKKDVVKRLLELAKNADEVYLATDPDREGEAISWHLEYLLGIPEDRPCRIEFNEISQKAVKHALENPRTIDLRLVDAQQARRVLDRLVGYKLSPLLCKKIAPNLSGGRVQSVALRLTVDREREISVFVPEEYWLLTAMLKKDGMGFKSLLASKDGKKFKPKCQEEMDEVVSAVKNAQWVVGNVKKSVTKSHAPAPFITSSMQQDALNKLGMTLKQSQSVAQKLYEGVEVAGEGKLALVTYIRTDSTRVSADAQNAARQFITQKFGERYIPEKPNFYKSKNDAQDAHEAIRPINIEVTPDSLKNKIDKQCFRLYKLIYDRFLASQMSEAEYNSVHVDIKSDRYGFKTTGKTLLFAGYTAAYANYKDEADAKDDENGENATLPELNTGDECSLDSLKPEQKFTKPPARYTEASLIKMMEEKGIGRPATYTAIITTLFSRAYCEKDGKFIRPTELGCNVTDMLLRYFEDIMDVGFTADMETKLDEIEFGGKVWQNVVGEFYSGFEKKLIAASGDDYSLRAAPIETDIKCEKCGSPMVIRESKYGKFLACSNYPKCKNTHHLDQDGNVVKAAEPVVSEEKCPECGAPLLIKKGKYGDFLGCSDYPKCHYIKNLSKPENTESIEGGICPKCGGVMIKRHSYRGDFYGCSNYPTCKFLSTDPIIKEKCPQCGGYMVKHVLKSGTTIRCGNKECGYSRPVEDK